MKWYYVEENEKKGPFEEAGFLDLIETGTISSDTLVWNESMTEWQPYSEIKTDSVEIAPEKTDVMTSEKSVPKKPAKASSAPRSFCSMCGKSFLQENLIPFENKLICARCKPTFLQQIKENAEVTGKTILHYAGFWKRALAIILDAIVLYILSLVITIPLSFLAAPPPSYSSEGVSNSMGGFVGFQILITLLSFLIRMAYEVILTYKYEATLGKMALGIKVVRSDGSHITLGQSFGRYFSKIVSAIILYIGFIMAAFSDEKCALHDHMCNTRVIRK